MLTLSIASLRRHGACSLDARVADLRRVLPDVGETIEVPLRVWWDLPTTTVPDRWWSLRAVTQAADAHRLGVRGAALAARRVLPLTREQKRPVSLAAIEAAEAWAAEPTDERRRAAEHAERAAYAAYAYVTFVRTAGAAAATAYGDYADAASAAAVAYDTAARSAVAVVAAHYAEIAAQRADLEIAAQRADLGRLLAEVSP